MGMDLQWVQIDEFPNYEIRADGTIRNKKTGRIKQHSKGARGYPVVSFRKDGKMFLRTLHVVLARTFIDNPENKPQVNHIDGNKDNYALDNLEWCTSKENMMHARKNGLHISDGDKRTAQLSMDGEVIAIFKSASEASRVTGVGRCNITGVANGHTRQKSAGGYRWKYV